MTSRNLLIVESPGKIKKLSKILGPAWTVKASVGHIRELANDGDHSLGFDLGPQHIDCRYIPRSDKAKQVISGLRGAVRNADQVFLATDPDREGETIAWHLQDELKLTSCTFLFQCRTLAPELEIASSLFA